MKIKFCFGAIFSSLFFLFPFLSHSQSGPSLPVYFVTQTGVQPAQANQLATALALPVDMVVVESNAFSFVDPTNFLALPTVPITDPTVLSNFTSQSPNKYPSIPLRYEKVDLNAAAGLVSVGSNAAVVQFSSALSSSGLTPQYGTPAVTHTFLQSWFTNDDHSLLSVSNAIDTEVDYQFTLPSGYPLIGPGAVVHCSFAPGGRPTRVLYSARTLTAGPLVTLISSGVASNRAAAAFPGLNPQIMPQLVYYAPPLSITSVVAIIPWYRCGGTFNVTNPTTGTIRTANLMPIMIPATDDAGFVPSVVFVANPLNGGTEVAGSVRVSGGAEPYTYQWDGNNRALRTNSSTSISYSPELQLAGPKLSLSLIDSTHVRLTWYDAGGFFTLQQSSNLVSDSWVVLTNPVSMLPDGGSSVEVAPAPLTNVFYRLIVTNSTIPLTETVISRVIDANGVAINSRQSFSILAKPTPLPNITFTPTYHWGYESPYSPGLGTQDTHDWFFSMANPIFGALGTLNEDYSSLHWNYIDALDNPNGINDYVVDSNDILLHIGHGDSDEFFFVSPYGIGPLHYYDAIDSWGNNTLEWLGLLSCDVLQNVDPDNKGIVARWGSDIDGLHILMGFASLAGAETGFPKAFAKHMGLSNWWMPIYPAWFAAAKDCSTGSPAVLVPVGTGGVTDLNDYWWGRGAVGPRIRSSQIKGWHYLAKF